MGHYAVRMRRTASLTLSLGNITAPGASMRRIRIWDVVLGADASPAADNPFLFVFQRCTSAGTRSAVTPQAVDPADSAAAATAGENHTVEPAYTANAILLDVAMNQRTTMRWQVDPQDGLVIPATANNGIGIQTPVAGLVAITGSFRFQE